MTRMANASARRRGPAKTITLQHQPPRRTGRFGGVVAPFCELSWSINISTDESQ